MTNPPSLWAAIRSRGPEGMPAASLLDFDAGFALPASPNAHLVAPPGSALPAHRRHPMIGAAAEQVWETVLATAEAQPRTWQVGLWPERLQAQWVVRTPLLNFPDLVTAQVEAMPGGSGVVLYSRSLIGWSDIGANRRRARRWLRALDAAMRRG